MTDNSDYRKYLEEKFEHIDDNIKLHMAGMNTHINAQFHTVHLSLDQIDGKVEKINSRVYKLEKAEGEVKELITTHAGTCPSLKNIEDIKENLQEYNFFKKYPKLAVLIVSVAVIMVGMSAYQIAQKTLSIKQAVETA